MKYKVLLFDFDGTLVDSMPIFVGVMLRILDENNIAYAEDIVKTITPLGYGGTANYFIQLGLNLPQHEIINKMYQYAKPDYELRIPAKEYVISVLKLLRSKGCSLNVLTASPHEILDPCLRRLGIYDLFTNVWSCDDFDTTKADPEIYQRAAERLGVPIRELLFLDDNYHADLSAKKAGAAVCGVYDLSSAESEDDIRAISDYYIRDFSELLEWNEQTG